MGQKGTKSPKPKEHMITDDYSITEEVLGEGLNGKVRQCESKATGELYALKVIRDSPKARRELKLHWKAGHDCVFIVQIVDVYLNIVQRRECLLVVLELMKGGELFDRIQLREEAKRPFTEREVAQIMCNIGTAVRHLHDMNIAHRDLKPENLLYASKDDDAVIKLTDFGFAKKVPTFGGLRTPCYTPYYAPPEVLGPQKYDKSCDMWSLGVIMYILLCGFPPFYSSKCLGELTPGMQWRIRCGQYEFPSPEWDRVSSTAKQIVKSLLKANPGERPTISELMKTEWINDYSSCVPMTPLLSPEVLRQERDQRAELHQELTNTLANMRVDDDKAILIKKLGESNNSLLKRRRKTIS